MQDGGKSEGPIETYPKLWNLNLLTANGQEILRIPSCKKSLEFIKKELEATQEKEILPASIPEFPTVRRMTLGMNSPLVVPSLFARATVERQHRWLEPLVHWIYGGGLFQHMRYQDKLLDDSSKENERLNASKFRSAGGLENA